MSHYLIFSVFWNSFLFASSIFVIFWFLSLDLVECCCRQMWNIWLRHRIQNIWIGSSNFNIVSLLRHIIFLVPEPTSSNYNMLLAMIWYCQHRKSFNLHVSICWLIGSFRFQRREAIYGWDRVSINHSCNWAMILHFDIWTKSGLLLWSRKHSF